MSETARPFHETIVDAIKRCPSPRRAQIYCLLQLIKETVIPKDHDKIIAAIEEFFANTPGSARHICLAKEDLLAKKKASEERDKEVS